MIVGYQTASIFFTLRVLRVTCGSHMILDAQVIIHDCVFYTQHIKIYLQLLYYHPLKDCVLPVGCAIVFAT